MPTIEVAGGIDGPLGGRHGFGDFIQDVNPSLFRPSVRERAIVRRVHRWLRGAFDGQSLADAELPGNALATLVFEKDVESRWHGARIAV